LFSPNEKRLAFCLSVRGFVSPSIGQALADDAFEQFASTLWIVMPSPDRAL
jgi:hypothetical protein